MHKQPRIDSNTDILKETAKTNVALKLNLELLHATCFAKVKNCALCHYARLFSFGLGCIF